MAAYHLDLITGHKRKRPPGASKHNLILELLKKSFKKRKKDKKNEMT